MSNYPINLTEKQWQVIKNIVGPQERNRKNSLREIVNIQLSQVVSSVVKGVKGSYQLYEPKELKPIVSTMVYVVIHEAIGSNS